MFLIQIEIKIRWKNLQLAAIEQQIRNKTYWTKGTLRYNLRTEKHDFRRRQKQLSLNRSQLPTRNAHRDFVGRSQGKRPHYTQVERHWNGSWGKQEVQVRRLNTEYNGGFFEHSNVHLDFIKPDNLFSWTNAKYAWYYISKQVRREAPGIQ